MELITVSCRCRSVQLKIDSAAVAQSHWPTRCYSREDELPHFRGLPASFGGTDDWPGSVDDPAASVDVTPSTGSVYYAPIRNNKEDRCSPTS